MEDPSQFRISDEERHAVAEVLRQAAGEGRIDFEELDERLEATYAAKTYADLIPITEDLPTSNLVQPHAASPARTSASGAVVPHRSRENHLAIMSAVDRRGHWIVPERTTVLAVMGGANLDLREAEFSAAEVTFVVNAIMGGADIVVGPDVNVVVEGIGIMGGFSGPSSRHPAELTPDSPTVRVKGIAFWGGVNVHRKPPRNSKPGPSA
jgi:hypothetical protein